MSENKNERLHSFVSGHVQGVGFRHFVLTTAQRLNLEGWVRNLWDGRVEVVAQGKPELLEKLLEALKRGPTSARVTDVHTNWEAPLEEFTGFHVRSNA